jgi:hypothetical protein
MTSWSSKLFFFKNKEDAYSFHLPLHNLIVPCIAWNCTRAKVMAPCNEHKDFWNRINRKKKSFGISPPKGTWFAEKIMCLE